MEAGAVVLVLVLIFLVGALLGGKPPRKYSIRRCMGRKWKKVFPEAQKAEIRRFLLLFVDAFAFKDEYRLHFEPDDQILDIYKATTGKWGVDAMEFETLAGNLEQEYRLSLDSVWKDDLTLGELFAQAVVAQQGAPADAKSRAAER